MMFWVLKCLHTLPQRTSYVKSSGLKTCKLWSWWLKTCLEFFLKGLYTLNMKILSTFIHSYVVPNLYYFLSSAVLNRRHFEECFTVIFSFHSKVKTKHWSIDTSNKSIWLISCQNSLVLISVVKYLKATFFFFLPDLPFYFYLTFLILPQNYFGKSYCFEYYLSKSFKVRDIYCT